MLAHVSLLVDKLKDVINQSLTLKEATAPKSGAAMLGGTACPYSRLFFIICLFCWILDIAMITVKV